MNSEIFMVLEDELKLVIYHRYFSLPHHNYILTLYVSFYPYRISPRHWFYPHPYFTSILSLIQLLVNITLTLVLSPTQFYLDIYPDFDDWGCSMVLIAKIKELIEKRFMVLGSELLSFEWYRKRVIYTDK